MNALRIRSRDRADLVSLLLKLLIWEFNYNPVSDHQIYYNSGS
jgi:hypothetical protein